MSRFRLPNLIQAIGSFPASMARATLSGFKHVDSKEFDLRGRTCENCPDRNQKLNQCMRCMCFLRWKIPLATEDCIEWQKVRNAKQ